MRVEVCPNCARIDQVQSVRAVYESQTTNVTGTINGYSSGAAYVPGVGIVPTFGSTTSSTWGTASSVLAGALAPPPVPYVAQQGGGCGVAILGLFAGGVQAVVLLPLLVTGDPGLLVGEFLPLVLLLIWIGVLRSRARTRSHQRAAYETYSVEYPGMAAVWSAAVLCHRCHLTFVPAGVCTSNGAPVPVGQFQDLVVKLAWRSSLM